MELKWFTKRVIDDLFELDFKGLFELNLTYTILIGFMIVLVLWDLVVSQHSSSLHLNQNEDVNVLFLWHMNGGSFKIKN